MSGVGCGGFAAEFRLAGDERAREAGVGSCVASALVGLEDQSAEGARSTAAAAHGVYLPGRGTADPFQEVGRWGSAAGGYRRCGHDRA